MNANRAAAGAAFGAALGLPLLALAYLGEQLARLPSAAFSLFEWVSSVLPGQMITRLIELLVGSLQRLNLGATASLGKGVERLLADGLFLATLAILGGLAGALSPRLPGRPTIRGTQTVAGLALAGLLLVVGALARWTVGDYGWWLLLSVTWGAMLGWLLGAWALLAERPPDASRRRFLEQVAAGTVAVTAAGVGLGWLLSHPQAAAPGTGVPTSANPPPVPPGSGFTPSPGTRPELTPVSDFYRVDINIVPPRLDEATWRLEVSGLVDKSLLLSAADLRTMPAEDFYATLECISNNVGGDLISTTWFTGVPLAALLAIARLQPNAQIVKFTSADGYTESLPLQSALDPQSRLCFAMGGAPLPVEHGFPLRLFTPNRFGMKNPKWITKIEAAAGDYQGYWEQRTWNQEAWVQTTAVVDSARADRAGQLEAGGIAYAGARGIQKVEIQIDNGPWSAAQLKPALSGVTWVLWHAQAAAGAGRHRVTARATDGASAVQTDQPSPPHPNGATGYHSRDVQVPG